MLGAGRGDVPRPERSAFGGEHPGEQLVELQAQGLDGGDHAFEGEGHRVAEDEDERGGDQPPSACGAGVPARLNPPQNCNTAVRLPTMTSAAIIVAAGRSTRMNGGDKILADVNGRPLLAWTLEAFRATLSVVARMPAGSAMSFDYAVAPETLSPIGRIAFEHAVGDEDDAITGCHGELLHPEVIARPDAERKVDVQLDLLDLSVAQS